MKMSKIGRSSFRMSLTLKGLKSWKLRFDFDTCVGVNKLLNY